jgi:hypothetical protein
MFAVIVEESGDAKGVWSSVEHLTANVVPQARRAPGIVSATWTADEGGRTVNMLLFEDEQSARAALERIRSAPRPPFMRVDSVELKEVLAHF